MSYNNLILQDESIVLQRNTGIQLAIEAISLATSLQKPHKLHQHLHSGEAILEYNEKCKEK